MKLSALATLAVGAGLVQVAAVPIRVILVSSNIQGGPAPLEHVRFGHAASFISSDDGSLIGPAPIDLGPGVTSERHRFHRPCKGRMSAMRQKSIEISNSFRKALGWPLIEPHHSHHPHHPPHPHFAQHIKAIHVDIPHPYGRPHARPSPPHSPIDFQVVPAFSSMGPNNFSDRLIHSLANLGRWEGRAVAFVLGCGIGVLLRMFYVLFIVAFRAIRGSREDEQEYSHVIMFEAADVVDAPATYASPADEKEALESHNKIVDSVKPCHR